MGSEVEFGARKNLSFAAPVGQVQCYKVWSIKGGLLCLEEKKANVKSKGRPFF